MVSRFSAGFSYAEVKNLLDVLTPVKGFKRQFGLLALPESYVYPLAPLVRAADITLVDPPEKWSFRSLVIEYLHTKNPEAEKAIREQLIIWSDNYKRLQPLFASSALAKEIEPHSKYLSELSLSCLEALDMYQAGKQPGTQWLADQQAVLKAAAGSEGEVELAVLPELTALISRQWTDLPDNYPML